ncbi:acetylcholinesterase-like [Ixodes scapularis]|uniref:acetylcholinesterase-like n=1 Tax=Ixodes scapularis TaxID=6945 RepID=UPI001AD63E3A|nr:acetylcholinesterase-like [Ixodes scapularis]
MLGISPVFVAVETLRVTLPHCKRSIDQLSVLVDAVISIHTKITLDHNHGKAIIVIRALFAVIWIAISAVVTLTSENLYSTPVAYPPSGPVHGVDETFRNHRLHVYYGVPFIKPPLLQNRFERLHNLDKPLPFLLDARHPPPSCLQSSRNVGKLTIDNRNTTEDCLYLNIFAPARKTRDNIRQFPVIVLLHGGGYYSGGNSFPFYSGRYLAAMGSAVVVVPNYRLGIFGFYRSKPLGLEGNQGLWDVYMAVKWVSKNVAAFGGNPDSVTLLGHDVGAALLGLLNTIENGSSLYHRAIMMSGNPFMRHWKVQNKDASKDLDKLLKKMSCERRVRPLDCLRSRTDNIVLDSAQGDANWRLIYIPTEYDDIKGDDITTLKETVVEKDLIIGVTESEGAHFGNLFLEQQSVFDTSNISQADLEGYLKIVARGLGITNVEELIKFYKDGYDPPVTVIGQAFGDLLFNCPMMQFAEETSKENINVYMYVFRYKPSYSITKLSKATHMDDVFLSLGYALNASQKSLNITLEERHLSEDLLKLWTSFATTGSPGALRNVTWTKYTKKEANYLSIAPVPQMNNGFRKEACEKVPRLRTNGQIK